jgi:hypothetical protein
MSFLLFLPFFSGNTLLFLLLTAVKPAILGYLVQNRLAIESNTLFTFLLASLNENINIQFGKRGGEKREELTWNQNEFQQLLQVHLWLSFE